MTDHLIAAYREDIDVRTEGLEHEPADGYRVDVHEIAPGVVYDSGGVRVTAIPVLHGSWRYAYGYRFDTPGRVVVISGDTRPSEALERAAAGADVLVHEVYSADELRRLPDDGGRNPDWPRYMHEFHTSDVELGALAARAAPKLLILSHLVRRDATDSALLAGVRAGGFSGRTVVGHDLDRF
jgi:ribonuclease BN (tRNA processing enzyme)